MVEGPVDFRLGVGHVKQRLDDLAWKHCIYQQFRKSKVDLKKETTPLMHFKRLRNNKN
jgi:hypothetical protein